MPRRLVPADLARAREVTRLVGEAAAKAGLPPEKGRRLELAVEEAFVNICLHAYPDGGGEVALTIDVEPAALTVELEDTGPAFDPLAPSPQPDGDLATRPLGGVGLPMIRRLPDRADYRRDGGRNVLTLVLERSS